MAVRSAQRALTVAHLLPWPGIGGTEHATLRIARAAAERGYRNVAFYREDSPVVGEFFRDAGLETAPYALAELSVRRPVPFARNTLAFDVEPGDAARENRSCSESRNGKDPLHLAGGHSPPVRTPPKLPADEAESQQKCRPGAGLGQRGVRRRDDWRRRQWRQRRNEKAGRRNERHSGRSALFKKRNRWQIQPSKINRDGRGDDIDQGWRQCAERRKRRRHPHLRQRALMESRDAFVLGLGEVCLGSLARRALMDDLEKALGALDRSIGEVRSPECRDRRARRKQQEEHRAADQQRPSRRLGTRDRASDGIMPESAIHPVVALLRRNKPLLEKTSPVR